MWGWKDWQDDLALPQAHPKKVFIQRVLELETRLSYFDRIKGTVPEAYVEAGMIAAEAPAPVLELTDAEHPHHLAAADVMTLMRAKESRTRLNDYLDKMKVRLQADPVCMIEADAEAVGRDVVVQTLLTIGSRSFSHFLNILERYIDLLRDLTASPTARLHLLRIVGKFWRTNQQFQYIVIDKLLQYRVVDPVDAITFVFEATSAEGPKDWSRMQSWDLLKGVVTKVNDRVNMSRAKVEGLKREAERVRDEERAAGGETDTNMEATEPGAEADAVAEPAAATNEELIAAEKLHESNVSEQRSVLVEVVRRFDAALQSVPAEGEDGRWSSWWLKAWYKEFCRLFSTDIAKYTDAFEALGLAADGEGRKALDQAQVWIDFAGASQ